MQVPAPNQQLTDQRKCSPNMRFPLPATKSHKCLYWDANLGTKSHRSVQHRKIRAQHIDSFHIRLVNLAIRLFGHVPGQKHQHAFTQEKRNTRNLEKRLIFQLVTLRPGQQNTYHQFQINSVISPSPVFRFVSLTS